ncbi:nuclear transport factor 2 family protein [Streptomyces sp. NBC_00091]|uniref:nuclear transport factor 2 family protein n=1 Tax=Streptomyces sp. NBC_00091 TaxID=2975648 RepID=UPI002258AD6F|nr:nuclear transport factor 2 family protein [Streptomyces sp. NBC_00091]MCX5377293.1 nuclear transport factor 2 family protein [Streptomyces sp. NBC_00091]
MADHPHIAVFHRVLAAFSAGDMEALAREFQPDVVWHIGGRNLLTGDYQGREDTFALLGREFQLTGGTYRARLHHVLANDDHMVALLHVTASRENKELDLNLALVLRMRDSAISEGWVLPFDWPAYDDFWS